MTAHLEERRRKEEKEGEGGNKKDGRDVLYVSVKKENSDLKICTVVMKYIVVEDFIIFYD